MMLRKPTVIQPLKANPDDFSWLTRMVISLKEITFNKEKYGIIRERRVPLGMETTSHASFHHVAATP